MPKFIYLCTRKPAGSNGVMVATRDLKSLGHCDRVGSSPTSSTDIPRLADTLPLIGDFFCNSKDYENNIYPLRHMQPPYRNRDRRCRHRRGHARHRRLSRQPAGRGRSVLRPSCRRGGPHTAWHTLRQQAHIVSRPDSNRH